ncbi:MAG: Lrp/AsnC ligand binding domain-containing protein [archaeon]
MVLVYMLINAKHGKNMIVAGALEKLDNVVELHEVYGRYDLIAKLEEESMGKMRTFIQNKIIIIEGIVRCETLFVSDTDIEDDSEEEADDEDVEVDEEEEFI